MRILVVDDREIIRDGIKILLHHSREDFDISEADNGQEAVSRCMEDNFDLIIMDINMPVLDGISATKQILEKKPASKILGLSLNGETAIINKFKESGAQGYVLKDFIYERLIRSIDMVMKGETCFPSAV